MLGAIEVVEPCGLALELQLDQAGRPVPLLADDDLGDVVDAVHVLLPTFMCLGAGLGLAPLELVLLAVDEQHHVGVLLDGPGFAKVGKQGPLVFPLFDGAA